MIEVGLEGADPPPVARRFARLTHGRVLSSISWGIGEPETVLLHGGFESARSWDLLALTLERPALALDLPGCGRSDWIQDGNYWSAAPADVAEGLERFVRAPTTLVGLSFGGIVAIRVAALRPDLIRRLVLIDVLPGCAEMHAPRVESWLRDDPGVASLEVLVERRSQLWASRSRGFLCRHVEREHRGPRDRMRPVADCRLVRWTPLPDFKDLWPALARIEVPVVFVRAERSHVVQDSELRQLAARRPDATILSIPAHHHVPIDQPRALAAVLRAWTQL
jgi:pimeloyl-ACP methyl ester carboxylesterase